MRKPAIQLLAATCLVAISVSFEAIFAADDPLLLIKDGVANCVIVIGDDAPNPVLSAKPGAAIVRKYLQKISGADVQVLGEAELTAENSKDKVLILIGDGKRVKELGLSRDGLHPEGFLQKTIGNQLVILGGDDRNRSGTYFGAIDFVERQLDVRWIMPFDLGEVVPQRQTIMVQPYEFRDQPKFLVRHIRNSYDNNGLWDVSRPFMGDESRHQKVAGGTAQWFPEQRLAFGIKINGAHSDDGMFAIIGKTHPEWFAMQTDGERRVFDGAKFCVSNPEYIRFRAEMALDELKKNPGIDSIGLSPSDGADNGFCMCANCKAWDDPRAKLLDHRNWNGSASFKYVAVSDRYARYYSEVAKIVCEKHPQVRIVGMAYGHYDPAPLQTKIHPNVVILYVGESIHMEHDRAATRANVIGWGKAGAQIAWRPNWLAHNAWILGYPHYLAENMREFYRAGMRFADFDTCVNDWGANGLNFYVLAKLLWDPEQDVDALIQDYLQHGYGPAAKPMARYFELVEQVTEKMTAETDPTIFWYYEVARFWTSDVFQSLHHLLDEADSEAAKSADVYVIRKRIELCREALQFQQIRLELSHAIKEYQEKKIEKSVCEKLLGQRNRWIQEHRYTEAMPVPYIMYQDNRYRRYYEP